ncbi:hypothetical protein ACIRD3_39395 [Kitasatospora sp. NPDC093550]|uniref:hypothetical protein n=1 Tax=Kitasatospora sp. NPDC093550 TaxID=3364089 RepID=UPI003823C0A4
MANTQNVERPRIPGCLPGEEPYELVPPARMAGLQKWRATPAEERERKERSWSARMKACSVWAQEHGVRLVEGSDDPAWLLKVTSRRDYGLRPEWLDHPLCWAKDRRPAAITASLYDYGRHAQAIHGWLADKPGIGLTTGRGWYHDGTVQIVLWRCDVLGDGVTAADAGPDALRWL